MNREIFLEQISRLRSEWPNSYGEERIRVLWDAFKNENDVRFIRAITRCIQTLRSAPLLPELIKAVEEISVEDKNITRDRQLTDGSIRGILENAQARNKRADPEFVKQCMKLLRDKLDGKITHQQFLQGCDLLDTAAKIGAAR